MLATERRNKILIVDRDVAAVETLRQRLSDAGFAVQAMCDGEAAAIAMAQRPPDLLIIDWNMPGAIAMSIIKSIRGPTASQYIRLIILSALGSEQDIIAGLNLGADDYVAKPFSLREVVARVTAVLRSGPREAQGRELNGGKLLLDPTTNRVLAHGQLVNLRGAEYRLLEFLMSHPGKTFNRGQLLTRVWGADSEIDERTVDVNVQRLRKLLDESGCGSYVQTIRGFGYRFSVPPQQTLSGN